MQEQNEAGIEKPMEQDCKGEGCGREVTREYEEATFSVLVALIPLVVFTFFGQAGLF